jgi:dihydropteroate synthase
VILRRDKPEAVDVARDATEAICLESFQPLMRHAVEKGERLPRDAEMVKAFPQFFGLLIPMSELQEVNEHG